MKCGLCTARRAACDVGMGMDSLPRNRARYCPATVVGGGVAVIASLGWSPLLPHALPLWPRVTAAKPHSLIPGARPP